MALDITLRNPGADFNIVLSSGGTTGQIKVYNGSTWDAKPLKVYNGSTWDTKPVKHYNGSTWETTNY